MRWPSTQPVVSGHRRASGEKYPQAPTGPRAPLDSSTAVYARQAASAL